MRNTFLRGLAWSAGRRISYAIPLVILVAIVAVEALAWAWRRFAL